MTARYLWPWMGLLLPLMPAAHAQDAQTREPQGYRAVMQAQYAAKTPPVPAQPEEAQKIYDTYLQSIGRPLKEQTGDTQDAALTPSH